MSLTKISPRKNDLKDLLYKQDFVLMEAAVGEYLQRQTPVQVDSVLGSLSCIYDPAGRQALQELYTSFFALASKNSVPLLITAPTWRANARNIGQIKIPATANRDALEFIHQVRTKIGSGHVPDVLLGGLLGPCFDAYRPDLGLSAQAARDFHAWQVEELAQAGAEYLMAATLPALEEAKGMAQVMTRTQVPSVISFVTNKQGCLLDGHTLAQAIEAIDELCTPRPVGYMINCSYPSFFHPDKEPAWIFSRLIGFQANASSLEHHELDEADEVHADDIHDWGDRLLHLHHRYGLKILGGCCGTGVEHLAYLVHNRHRSGEKRTPHGVTTNGNKPRSIS